MGTSLALLHFSEEVQLDTPVLNTGVLDTRQHGHFGWGPTCSARGSYDSHVTAMCKC